MKVLLTLLIIYSKLVNITSHSEVLLRFIMCLWRSDTYLRLLASGSSKIKSDQKTSAYSEMSMTFYKWQGELAGCTAPKYAWDTLCQISSESFNNYFCRSSGFSGQSDVMSNVYVVIIVQQRVRMRRLCGGFSVFLCLNLVIQPQQSSWSHLVQSLVLTVISRQYNLIFILFLLKFFRKTLCQEDHCFFCLLFVCFATHPPIQISCMYVISG